MAVEVKITGNGTWSGGSAELASYSVDEESTPIEGADTAGAVPQISFQVVATDQTPLLFDSSLLLSDGSNGTIGGRVSGLTTTDGITNLVAETVMAKLVGERRIPPHNGTLQSALTAYLGLCGISSGFVFDTALQASTRPVAVQGYFGSVWDFIKMFGVSQNFEVALVSNTIVFRPLRKRTAYNITDMSVTTDIQLGEVAKSVEVIRYNNTYRSNSMVYPAGGWSEDLEIYSVGANETIEVEIPVDVSLMSITQPQCTQFVERTHNSSSVYTVTGNDGLPISPSLWNSWGGSVTAKISDDSRSIILTIVGMTMDRYAPYSLSLNSGETNAYSTLRLVGDGVHYSKEVVTFPTGADPLRATQDVGITIDNPTIQNVNEVATIGLRTARRYSSPTRTLNARALVTNRPGEQGYVNYITFGEFEAARAAGYTFTSFKTEFSGKTFAQIQAQLQADSNAGDKFENQAFGNVAGSIVRSGYAWYRIRHATITAGEISYSAEADTTFQQYKTEATGKTFAQIKTARTGMTFAEVSIAPLKVT